MTQPNITSFPEVHAYLGGPDKVDAVLARTAYEAAEAYVGKRCRWAVSEPAVGETWPPAPDDLVQAVKLQTARMLQRRQSPDGLVGMGDLGIARVPISDRDVDALMRPYRPVVFG
jgi:hypothetical protein